MTRAHSSMKPRPCHGCGRLAGPCGDTVEFRMREYFLTPAGVNADLYLCEPHARIWNANAAEGRRVRPMTPAPRLKTPEEGERGTAV